MKNVDAVEGDKIDFKVKVVGFPKPAVVFTRNGKEVKDDGKHIKIEEDGDSYRLIIDKVTKDDMGTYSCVAKNEHGTKSSDGDLNIKSKPSFKKKFGDVQSKEGDEMIEMTVQIEGSPTSVKWLLDGKEIKDGPNYKVIADDKTGIYKLQIPKVASEMAGKYTCEAINSEGKSECSGAMTVNSAPAFTQKLKDVQTIPGEKLVLDVKVKGEPAPEVKWAKDGEEISSDKIIKEKDGQLKLIVENVSEDDSGIYSCSASNIYGEMTTDCKVDVSSKPAFKKGLSNKEANEGESVEFTVETMPQAFKPTIRWFIGDMEINESKNKFELIPDVDSDKYKLKIKSADQDTAGTIKCICTNKYGSDETSASFTVVTKPKFITKLADAEAMENDPIFLSVTIDGTPTPSVKWLKDGEEVHVSANFILHEEKDGSHRLEVKKISVKDAGTYECKLTNKAGEASCKGKVNVVSKPSFIKNMEDIKVDEGVDVKFEVKVAGDPQPTVQWYYQDEQVSTKITAENEENVFRLIFGKAKKELAGEYYCVASNKIGSTKSKTGQLIINKSTKLEKPEFLKKMGNQSTMIGDSVKFVVKISGNPKPNVTWRINGEEVMANDSRYLVKDEGENTYSLLVCTVTLGDEGKYECIAKNEAGQVKDEGTLSAKGKFESN